MTTTPNDLFDTRREKAAAYFIQGVRFFLRTLDFEVYSTGDPDTIQVLLDDGTLTISAEARDIFAEGHDREGEMAGGNVSYVFIPDDNNREAQTGDFPISSYEPLHTAQFIAGAIHTHRYHLPFPDRDGVST